MPNAKESKPPIKKVNLLAISRSPDVCRTSVHLEWDWDTRIEWLVFGEASLHSNERRDGQWTLEARMGLRATDCEHDTAFALRLPLIGVEFECADHHTFRFHGWVDPNSGPDERGKFGKFHVPPPGYAPHKHPEAKMCPGVYIEKTGPWCKWNDKKPHVIVPDGFYVPPFDPDLFALVAGKKVSIVMGKAPDKRDEE